MGENIVLNNDLCKPISVGVPVLLTNKIWEVLLVHSVRVYVSNGNLLILFSRLNNNTIY